MQERRDATYLAILTGVWVLVGAGVSLLSHRLWLESRDLERQGMSVATAWHALWVEVPFVLLGFALYILRRVGPAPNSPRGEFERIRPAAAALCATTALVTALGVAEYRTLAATGHGLVLRLGPAPEMLQFLLAGLGTVVAAALTRRPAADSRRP